MNDMTPAEVQAETAKLKLELRARDAKETLGIAATKSDIRNFKVIYRMYKDDFEFDENGKLSNADEILKTAQKESPELFNAPTPAKQDNPPQSVNGFIRGSGGSGSNGQTDKPRSINDFIRKGSKPAKTTFKI